LRGVAGCCSVLRCVTMCCCAVQSVAAKKSADTNRHLAYGSLGSIAPGLWVLQCVAACCGALQCHSRLCVITGLLHKLQFTRRRCDAKPPPSPCLETRLRLRCAACSCSRTSSHILWCIVCCNVLQCVLQCVAVCCSVLQRVPRRRSASITMPGSKTVSHQNYQYVT